jgi:DNA-binding protein YbaB
VTTPIDPSDFSGLLSQALSALDEFQSKPETGEPAEGIGQAANGLVIAKAAPPGRISELSLDAKALRMPSEWVAEEVMKAVNHALTDLNNKTDIPAGKVDFSSLDEKLQRIQADAGRQFSALADSLVEAQTRITRQGGKG